MLHGPDQARPSKQVQIEELIQLLVNQEGNVIVKVVSGEDVGIVTRKEDGKELKKQNVVVGDSSGCSHIVLIVGGQCKQPRRWKKLSYQTCYCEKILWR